MEIILVRDAKLKHEFLKYYPSGLSTFKCRVGFECNLRLNETEVREFSKLNERFSNMNE